MGITYTLVKSRVGELSLAEVLAGSMLEALQSCGAALGTREEMMELRLLMYRVNRDRWETNPLLRVGGCPVLIG